MNFATAAVMAAPPLIAATAFGAITRQWARGTDHTMAAPFDDRAMLGLATVGLGATTMALVHQMTRMPPGVRLVAGAGAFIAAVEAGYAGAELLHRMS